MLYNTKTAKSGILCCITYLIGFSSRHCEERSSRQRPMGLLRRFAINDAPVITLYLSQ
jgi:hypothetical protein